MANRTQQESTTLLEHSVQDDFRQFMNTEERERRHKLAKKTVLGEVSNTIQQHIPCMQYKLDKCPLSWF